MNNLNTQDAQPSNTTAGQAVLTAEITITRKATGIVEHYTITGTQMPKEPNQQKEL